MLFYLSIGFADVLSLTSQLSKVICDDSLQEKLPRMGDGNPGDRFFVDVSYRDFVLSMDGKPIGKVSLDRGIDLCQKLVSGSISEKDGFLESNQGVLVEDVTGRFGLINGKKFVPGWISPEEVVGFKNSVEFIVRVKHPLFGFWLPFVKISDQKLLGYRGEFLEEKKKNFLKKIIQKKFEVDEVTRSLASEEGWNSF